jgi:hypothetical protein
MLARISIEEVPAMGDPHLSASRPRLSRPGDLRDNSPRRRVVESIDGVEQADIAGSPIAMMRRSTMTMPGRVSPARGEVWNAL